MIFNKHPSVIAEGPSRTKEIFKLPFILLPVIYDHSTVFLPGDQNFSGACMPLKISDRGLILKYTFRLKLKSPCIKLTGHFSRQARFEQLTLQNFILKDFKLSAEEFCLPVISNFHLR